MLLVVLIFSTLLWEGCGFHLFSGRGLWKYGQRSTVESTVSMSTTETPKDIENKQNIKKLKNIDVDKERMYDGAGWDSDDWEGHQEGFDWQLERARRLLEGPGFAPIRMTIWQPDFRNETTTAPTIFDHMKILLNNVLSMAGLAESLDGAPVVQGIGTFDSFKSNPVRLLSRIIDGDLAEIAGGPLFLLLNDYYKKYGPVYKLAFGPKSFMVVSDPVMAKHILKEQPQKYDKGILAEILYPIMGKGLIPADPATWKVRRRAIVPGFHKAWLNAMMKLFVNCNKPLVSKLDQASITNTALNMETEFCSVSLDIIGKAVFNYDFGSVTKESPIVKAVYRTLQEAEHRSTSFIPFWDLPLAKYYMKNLQDFEANIQMLNDVLDQLIENALNTKDEADIADLESRDYATMENPSLLRFLVDMRGEDTTSKQLRDDLMTMLIAGHETTAAVLTWTFFNLAQKPELYARVREEVDEVIGNREPMYEDMLKLPLIRLCLAETLRLYPEPPILIRRALVDDVLPKGGAERETFIPKGTDVFIATWNIHRSKEYWDNPEEYDPDRFLRPFPNPSQSDWAGMRVTNTNVQLYPNEIVSDFAFLPFGGGTRKCVGDQFAMMEAVATVVMILQKFDLFLATTPEEVGMKTGATIHTENGLMMKVRRRSEYSHTNSSDSHTMESNVHQINSHQLHLMKSSDKTVASDSANSRSGTDSKCPF